MNPYYPPGHPTGRRSVEVDLTCPNGHTYQVPGTYDEAVNYTDYDEDAPCPVCGEAGEEDDPEHEDDAA